jgi:trans-aconitate methyltransferase
MSEHWNGVYATRGVDERSWSEPEPATSLELLEVLGVTPRDSIIDIGAGESELVDYLRVRGFTDLSVLDLSSTALGATRERVGHDNVVTIEADVTTWHPARHYDVWHDRAVLHFLSAPDAQRYAATLRDALSAGGAVVIGVFAPDGPESCSGLAVTRYGAEDLAALLGEEFRIVTERRVRHRTPWGTEQSFQWIAARCDERTSRLSASNRMAD